MYLHGLALLDNPCVNEFFEGVCSTIVLQSLVEYIECYFLHRESIVDLYHHLTAFPLLASSLRYSTLYFGEFLYKSYQFHITLFLIVSVCR